MDKVIVADAELRTSLAVIRSLSKYGLKVISISRGRTNGYLSKYSWKKFDLSSLSDESYIDFILTVAEFEKVKAIFAHFEKTLFQLYERASSKKNNFTLIMPPIEKLRFASEKQNILAVATDLGIPVPETICVRANDENIYSIVEERLPCFIKATTEIDLPPGPGSRYLLIKSSDDIKYLSEFIKKHKLLLIQQYIKGYGCGIAGIFHEGKVIAIGGHIRLRESFDSGGVSTYCRSYIHKDALNYAVKLMDKLKWTGIAMIEFKVSLDGVPYLMEVNPRIWGTIPLYIASGIDIPVVAYELFVNKKVDRYSNRFKEGIEMRFLIEDLQAVRKQYSGLEKIREYFKIFMSMYRVREGTFEIKDPLPFVLPLFKVILNKVVIRIKGGECK